MIDWGGPPDEPTTNMIPNDEIPENRGHEVHSEAPPQITATSSEQALAVEEVNDGLEVADDELRDLADDEEE